MYAMYVFYTIVGVMDHKDVEDKKQTRGLRRAFGAAGRYLIKLVLKVWKIKYYNE